MRCRRSISSACLKSALMPALSRYLTALISTVIGPAAALAGGGQRFGEHVDVADIDLARRNHPGRPVDATVGVKGERGSHDLILTYM